MCVDMGAGVDKNVDWNVGVYADVEPHVGVDVDGCETVWMWM